MGAALVAMVARICAENPKYAAQRDLATRIVAAADAVRRELDDARGRDEKAFARVIAAQGLPRETAEEKEARARALEAALLGAAEAPLHACELAIDVLRLAAQALQIPNRNLVSDLGCAAEFGFAALAACGYNVRVNHRFMKDAKAIDAQAKLLARYENEASALLARLRHDVNEALTNR
jgi:formiminotetrahydrofolate cyclodeaminase